MGEDAYTTRLKELAALFLRLGVTAFGGPAAHIGMMQQEVVVRRKWLTAEEFLDLLGTTNLIPGPNSTEMAIHIGLRRAGWRGLVLAGLCFILPAALITYGLAWAYIRFGSLPRAQGILYGVKPVIIAVVVQAIWVLAKTALKTRWLIVAAGAALGASFIGVNELVVLVAAGGFVAGLRVFQQKGGSVAVWQPIPLIMGGSGLATVTTFSSTKLFLLFLKIGSVLFGSGYVLLAFLRADFVDRHHWLTEGQLMDAVAVGQLTPGPVFTTATFIGYLMSGTSGAFLATSGIFLPSFVFVALSGALVPRVRHSTLARAFLDGVNVASLALMAAVTWELGRAALVDFATIALACLSALLLLRFKLNSAWLVLGGGAVGFALKQVPW
jgi:chromate transporter